ncbi:uncharacterized protein [Nicotiana sylvestris]|uniref:uncharacterized protein n=1 Tax=Nicotiana sylvestris TaxID=4096 RepID=UPI00388C7FB7
MATLQDEILAFKQEPTELLHEIWELYRTMVKECPNNDMTEGMIQQTFYRGINTTNQCIVNKLTGGNFTNLSYDEACNVLDEMDDTSSASQSRANVPQGDPMAQLQQVQNPRQENAMEGVSMLVNKIRQRRQQNQGNSEQYDDTCDGFQNDDVELQDDEAPLVVEENVNNEVRIDINESEVETQDAVNPSREHVIDMPELSLSINVPLVEELEQMPGYAKFMKDSVIKKRSMDCETIKMTHQVSVIVHSMALNLEDPSAFTIPCTIGSAYFAKTLCNLGASINLMPYSVFKTLGIGQPRPTSMRLQMEDRSMKRPLGIIDNVLIRVDKFILQADFVILDCELDYEVPIILGRPFLAMGKALVDVEAGELTFRVGDEKVIFHVCKSMKQPNSTEVCSFVDFVTAMIVDDTSAMINGEDPLEAVL